MDSETKDIHPLGDLITLTMPDGRQEIIDMTTKTPINDPNCRHEKTVTIGDGDIPGTVEVTCADCPVGWYMRP